MRQIVLRNIAEPDDRTLHRMAKVDPILVVAGLGVVWWKLHAGVEAQTLEFPIAMCQRCDEMDLADTLLAANAPPAPEGRRRIGQLLRKIDEQYRRPIDADVAGIPKEWQ